ncbi:hypothetical protein [Devosia sp. SD17-2]|nr:hypothetical protein [Devosia sp. SD17-2]WEJ32804.1 hypothetical protein NYQ88_18285 [Devosia sp. SD17-2]
MNTSFSPANAGRLSIAVAGLATTPVFHPGKPVPVGAFVAEACALVT